jgi:toxin ParE1/3/4
VRVRWLRSALRNLDEIHAYVLADDPRAADRLIARIEEAVGQIAHYPALGRAGRVEGTRELVISGTPYIVPYRVRGEVLEILRVHHGARRWPPTEESK